MCPIFVLLCAFSLFAGSNCLIVPNEIPSLLSLIYSNIPTIKKGTDSRLGWGFRLGDRADFQVLVELGPQINTQPLANQTQPNTTNKRNVPIRLADVLYAQRQREKPQISNTDGGKWLQQWSEQMGQPVRYGSADEAALEPRPGLGVGEIDAKSVIPDDSAAIEKLQAHRSADGVRAGEKERTSTEKTTSTAAYKDALDNVEIDD